MDIDTVVRALRICNMPKGHRCSECPVFSRYEHRICKATVDRFAADLIETLQAQLAASQRRERAAVEDMLKVLLSQLEKEKAIISNEHGKDYAHLNFADGRRHTLMRVEAWAKTQIKEWRGQEAGNQKGAEHE